MFEYVLIACDPATVGSGQGADPVRSSREKIGRDRVGGEEWRPKKIEKAIYFHVSDGIWDFGVFIGPLYVARQGNCK